MFLEIFKGDALIKAVCHYQFFTASMIWFGSHCDLQTLHILLWMKTSMTYKKNLYDFAYLLSFQNI